MGRKPNDRASRVEVIAINDRLREAVVKLPDGMCHYKEGQSDRLIAEELGVSLTSVSGLRQQVFGHLRPANGANDTRIDDCVRMLANLEKCFADLKEKHNALCSALSLNRVLDVRSCALGPKPAPTQVDGKLHP